MTTNWLVFGLLPAAVVALAVVQVRPLVPAPVVPTVCPPSAVCCAGRAWRCAPVLASLGCTCCVFLCCFCVLLPLRCWLCRRCPLVRLCCVLLPACIGRLGQGGDGLVLREACGRQRLSGGSGLVMRRSWSGEASWERHVLTDCCVLRRSLLPFLMVLCCVAVLWSVRCSVSGPPGVGAVGGMGWSVGAVLLCRCCAAVPVFVSRSAGPCAPCGAAPAVFAVAAAAAAAPAAAAPVCCCRRVLRAAACGTTQEASAHEHRPAPTRYRWAQRPMANGTAAATARAGGVGSLPAVTHHAVHQAAAIHTAATAVECG